MTVNKPPHISSVISSFAGCSDFKWWGKCHNFMCLLVCVSRHNACIRAQSCPTLCNPMDCSLLGSSLHGISQLKILRWVTIPFFKASSWPRDQKKERKSEVTQSCPTLCGPVDCSPPGSSIHGIFQARVLEWVAISFSRESSWPRDRTYVSCIAGRCYRPPGKPRDWTETLTSLALAGRFFTTSATTNP